MRYIVTRTYSPHDWHSREVDAEQLQELIDDYIRYLAPNSGTISIERIG